MSDLSPEFVKALTPFASLMYHQGYADALDAAVRVVELLGDRQDLVIESLRESAKDVRAKTCAAKTIAPEPKANPPASSSLSEGQRS